MGTEISGPEIEQIGQLRPEGRPPVILGTGLAVCADPAEALELASS